MTLYLLLGGCAMCAAVLAFSRTARRHVRAGWATLRDSETRRHERAVVILGLLLILSGGVIPGPLDELLGIGLIGWITRRVAARKAAA